MLNFLGTFNKSQLERLASFAREHLCEVEGRAKHLRAEITRIGTLTVVYDVAGKPTGYKANPASSYIGRLMGAYEVLGGDALYDLQVRSRDNPVFLLVGDELSTPRLMSNGEPLPERVLADAPSAKLVGSIRGWIPDVLGRRDALERKIRRALDYSDQLFEELELLSVITSSQEVEGSLENLIASIKELIADKGYRAIADDKGRDPYGKFTRAPYTSYEPGPAREVPEGSGVERGEEGYIIYGGIS